MSLADAGLSLLLDPDRLTTLVGRPVHAAHLRPKPGVSTTAALVDDAGQPWGWMRTLTGEARAKAAKARTVADEVGLPEELGEAELTGRDTLVQWGPFTTDPRLARELARIARVGGVGAGPGGVVAQAGGDLVGGGGASQTRERPAGSATDLLEGATVLRYNPLRRLVLRRDDLVLRVTQDRHRHRLASTTRALASDGVPVVVPWRSSADAGSHGTTVDRRPGDRRPADRRPAGERPARSRSHRVTSPRTSVWPWVPGQDASGSTDPDILRAAGEALGRLHGVDPAVLPDLPRRGWAQLRSAAGESVALLEQVDPAVASAAARALALLPGKDPGPHLPLVVVHGDFSLDQCLVGIKTLSSADRASASSADRASASSADRATASSAERASSAGRASAADTATAAAAEPTDMPPVDRPTLQLTDLDRAALSVPVLDHAVLLATALATDAPVLAVPEALAAFTDGYAGRTGRPVVVPGVWAAAALLARVAEPWRSQRPGWQVETARRSLLAARLATEEDSWGLRAHPVGAPATAIEAAGGSTVETITVDRAWPRIRDGVREITVEGRDRLGRVRGGTVGSDGIPRALPPGADPRLPTLARVAAGGEVVVHRAGRRAVVRTEVGYVKVLRPGRAPAVAEAGRVGATLARAAGLAAPEVLAADDDTVTFAALSGRPVHDLSETPEWAEVWRTWAQAWTRLQGRGPEGGDATVHELLAGLPRHTAEDEADVVTAWAARAQGANLVDGRWVARSRLIAERLRAAGDPARLVVTHRDLHDQQLLWDAAGRGSSRLGVLDLDTACLADPLLDPVNLAVHADLRRAQGLWSAEAAEAVVAASREVAGLAGVQGAGAAAGQPAAAGHSAADDAQGPGRPAAAGRPAASGHPRAAGHAQTVERWRTAELATVVRLVCVYAFRPRWRVSVERWAEERWAQERWAEEPWVDGKEHESSLMGVSPASPVDQASWVS